MINNIIWAIIIVLILINIIARAGKYFQSRQDQRVQQKIETMCSQNKNNPKKTKITKITKDQILRKKIQKNYNVFMPPEDTLDSSGTVALEQDGKINHYVYIDGVFVEL